MIFLIFQDMFIFISYYQYKFKLPPGENEGSHPTSWQAFTVKYVKYYNNTEHMS